MTRILLVKLSSLGDVIHNLAVVSDIHRHFPQTKIDWVTETPYAPLLQLHPALSNVLPLSLRKLKKNWWSASAWNELLTQRKNIKQANYDLVLDTQGLLKSAIVADWNPAPSAGFGASSAREPSAAGFYSKTVDIDRDLHAVKRNRDLAAAVLGYTATDVVDYGLQTPTTQPNWLPVKPYAVFLHATSRENKKWPLKHWVELGQHFLQQGITPLLPWGNAHEHRESKLIAEKLSTAIVPPAMTLVEAAAMLGHAQCVVGVDTGLAHLAVALRRPTIGLYISTSPKLTGLYGDANAINLGGGDEHAPSIPTVNEVWNTASAWLNK